MTHEITHEDLINFISGKEIPENKRLAILSASTIDPRTGLLDISVQKANEFLSNRKKQTDKNVKDLWG